MKSFKQLRESENINEISDKLADRYVSKVTSDQLKKQGFSRDMYSKLEPKRQKGISNAFKRLIKPVKEDGGGMGVGALSVPGPTNKTGPQSATDPVSATAVNMKKRKKTYATLRRAAPKM